MIHFKFVGIKDMHNIYNLGPAGERSLPFGLLVCFCTYSRPRYQVSIYRTIGSLVLKFASKCSLQAELLHDPSYTQALALITRMR